MSGLKIEIVGFIILLVLFMFMKLILVVIEMHFSIGWFKYMPNDQRWQGWTSEQKYLGFVISANGDNMASINSVKKKSIGIIHKMLTKLESLHLKNYFFECPLICFNIMLRASTYSTHVKHTTICQKFKLDKLKE